MQLGILQRYVIDQVLRSFLLVLVTLTSVIVLFMVIGQAAREGLAPGLMVKVIPYIVPQMMVYTVPVSLLFAVSVVYGRMASDNEVIATKAAGCSAWVLLWPSILLSIVLSGMICVLYSHFIPKSSFYFKAALFKDFEDTFFLVLKREGQFNLPGMPVFIGVKDVDVENRVLIGATFKHRAKGSKDPTAYDNFMQAKTAKVRFMLKEGMVELKLKDALLSSVTGNFSSVPDHTVVYPLPRTGPMAPEKKVQEMTSTELAQEKVKLNRLIKTEKLRQAFAASLFIGTGRITRVGWPHIRDAYRDSQRWERQLNEVETEAQLRVAMGTGGFFFVLLGAPVGILFARRDFLSAFMTCFMPIIVVYYPLVLMGMNFGKEGILPAAIVWAGNAVLAAVAGFFALPPVIKH